MLKRGLLKLGIFSAILGSALSVFAADIRFCVNNQTSNSYYLQCTQYFPDFIWVRWSPRVNVQPLSMGWNFYTAEDTWHQWSPNRGHWSCSLWDANNNEIVVADGSVGPAITTKGALVNIFPLDHAVYNWNLGDGVCR